MSLRMSKQDKKAQEKLDRSVQTRPQHTERSAQTGGGVWRGKSQKSSGLKERGQSINQESRKHQKTERHK